MRGPGCGVEKAGLLGFRSRGSGIDKPGLWDRERKSSHREHIFLELRGYGCIVERTMFGAVIEEWSRA